MLQGLPLPFVDYWLQIDKGWDFLISENWPNDYRITMKMRAKEAQRRLLGVVHERENITKVNFSKASPSVEPMIGDSVDDVESQFKLGKKYHDGIGVKVDLVKAAEYYSKPAELGHAKAQNNLGLLYSLGFETQGQDENKAAEWIMKAADQGLDIAQYNIASYFLEKNGVFPYDPEQAAMWYLKAAEQGNSDAQCSLAEMFENGLGVSQDVHQAKSFYLKAALQCDETAQSWLWRRARLENAEPSKEHLDDATSTMGASANFRLVPDHAIALVRAAIDLLKQNPTAFLPEIAELQRSVLANNVAAASQVTSTEELPFSVDASPLPKVAKWLLDQESVTFVALRTYLLPLDLLPRAIVDELNEWALDSIGEPALEEIGDEIVVVRAVLSEALSLRSKVANLTGVNE